MPDLLRSGSRTVLVALLWFGITFAAYALLGANVFYKTDGPDLLRLLASGVRHPWHTGYLPALGMFRDALALVGIELSPIRLGALFSAAGMALSVAFFHLALGVLSVTRARREAATLLLAASPAAVLFASVVEFHAPLMAVVGIAFWWTAVQSRRPSWWGMIALGALTHVSFLMHSSSVLLPGWLLPFFLARRWRESTRRRDLQLAVVAGVTHTALWFVLPRLTEALGSEFYGWHADLSKAYEMETSIGRPQSIDYLPEIVWQEWIWPLLPLSVTCLAAAFKRVARPEFWAFAIGFTPYIYLCVRQLVHEPEQGAYMLPLVPAAALLTAQALPARRFVDIAIGLFVASALMSWFVLDRSVGGPVQQRYRTFATDLEQAASGKPFMVLVGRHDEMAMSLALLKADQYTWIRTQATMPRDRYGPAVWASTATPLAGLHALGRAVLLTRGARDWLTNPAAMRKQEKSALEFIPNEEFAGPLFFRDLEKAYVLEPAAGDLSSPTVYRLVPR